jgi:hypothetical protein
MQSLAGGQDRLAHQQPAPDRADDTDWEWSWLEGGFDRDRFWVRFEIKKSNLLI